MKKRKLPNVQRLSGGSGFKLAWTKPYKSWSERPAYSLSRCRLTACSLLAAL